MILINCPHCGERNEDEFVYGGDVKRRRPEDPDALSDELWNAYIYYVPNTKGWADEHWWHVRGCNRWIEVRRNSINNLLSAVEEKISSG